MFLKKFDYISPPITFYHKNYLAHTSNLSGIISIFSFILILIISCYFALKIIHRNDPSVFNFKRIIEDAGTFPVNASSFFHFISLKTDTQEFYNGGMDFRSFRIIGLDVHHSAYLNNKNLSNFDFWLYDYCNNESDTKGISHLINFNFFKKSACIRKYFSSADQKYYNTDDPKFRWPVQEHGTSSPNNKYYNMVLERCEEDTINQILGEGIHCKTDNETRDLLSINAALRMYLIDHYIDVLNYKSPITKFFVTIENNLKEGIYPINHLNFYPSFIKTNKGLAFDEIIENSTYSYERNDVFTYNDDTNKIYTIYCFWLGNRIDYYERTYKRLQDIISNIGGFYQFIVFSAVFINRFYNSFIILFDTENLLNSSISNEKYNLLKKRKINEQKRIEEMNNKNYNKSAINKTNDKGISNERSFNKILNHSNIKNKVKSNNDFNNSEIGSLNISQNITLPLKVNISKRESVIENISKNFNNFWKFILFKLSIGKKKNVFEFYHKFRIKLLSEEHLIKNHLNIYILLRLHKSKMSNKRRYSFQLKDLIKIV